MYTSVHQNILRQPTADNIFFTVDRIFTKCAYNIAHCTLDDDVMQDERKKKILTLEKF